MCSSPHRRARSTSPAATASTIARRARPRTSSIAGRCVADPADDVGHRPSVPRNRSFPAASASSVELGVQRRELIQSAPRRPPGGRRRRWRRDARRAAVRRCAARPATRPSRGAQLEQLAGGSRRSRRRHRDAARSRRTPRSTACAAPPGSGCATRRSGRRLLLDEALPLGVVTADDRRGARRHGMAERQMPRPDRGGAPAVALAIDEPWCSLYTVFTRRWPARSAAHLGHAAALPSRRARTSRRESGCAHSGGLG